MAIRSQDKVSEREMSDIVVKKLNYIDNMKSSENMVVGKNIGSFKQGQTITVGTRLHDIIQGILDPSYESAYTFPTFKLESDSNIEVGNIVDIIINPVYEKCDAGPLNRYKLERSLNGGAYTTIMDGPHTKIHTEKNIKITDNDNIMTFRGTLWFDQGPEKYDNGEVVPGRIEAGKIIDVLRIAGIRRCFYGNEAGVVVPVQTNEEVRGLPNHTDFAVTEGSQVKLHCEPGDTRLTFAYPAYVRDPYSVISKKLGYDIVDIFEKSIIRVKGANGYQDIEYKVFTYIPDVPYGESDEYTIMI